MRVLFVLAVAAALAPMTRAHVWTTVYRCDETTPLTVVDPNNPDVYRDIMVGTRLTLIISSDAKGPWSGSLAVSWEDMDLGRLEARDFNAAKLIYQGSCLPAAGTRPFAQELVSPFLEMGFQFNADGGAVAGDWFIVDYRAQRVGSCRIGFYDGDSSWGVAREILVFRHVPSRDFSGDGLVNFDDFALLVSQWHQPVPSDVNEVTFDLDSDGSLSIGDLASFSEYWLEQTDCSEAGTAPAPGPEG